MKRKRFAKRDIAEARPPLNSTPAPGPTGSLDVAEVARDDAGRHVWTAADAVADGQFDALVLEADRLSRKSLAIP